MSPRSASGAPRQNRPLRAVALFVTLSIAAPHAQTVQSTLASNSEPAPPARSESESSEVQLLVGRSTVISVGQPITRVSLTTPNVADAMVTSPQQLLLHGKSPGTISLFVWDRAGGISRYEVVVQRDLSELAARLTQLFPGEAIKVTSNGKDVVLSGTVSGKYAMDKAAEVATGYVDKKEDVVNLLKQQDGVSTRQVLLRVRFAEVSRSALTELGVTLAANGFKDGRWFGRSTTQQFAAPTWDQDGKFVFSDFLNLFLFDSKNELAGAIRALQNKGLFQSLAEPNLIAEDGKEASFLAGGEYPYPVVQGQGGSTSIAIQFKEYGVRLNFLPTIVGTDLVKLKVRPEVSSLDFANAVTLQGFRVPAISTRRTETEVELQDGQTFAVAGLMNNTVTSQMSKIPGIGDIPILGLLFRTKAARKDQTELVVMITPTIVRRNSSGVSSTVPDMAEPFMPPLKKTVPPPAPWNRDGRPQPSTSGVPSVAPPSGNPASAPAGPAATTDPANVPATSAAAASTLASGLDATATPPREAVSAPAMTDNGTATAGTARKAGEQNGPANRAAAQKQGKAAAAQAAREHKAASEQAARESKVAAEQARRDQKAAAEQAARDRKAAAAQARVDAKKAAAAKVEAEKAAREQARLDAELQKRQAEAARRQAQIDKERGEEIARAEQKLKAAQKQYESALGQKQDSGQKQQ
jgi:pilus assembly protein CpaC